MLSLTAKKTYKFGKYQDAEVTVYHGTKQCRVVRYDPVGQYPPVVTVEKDYSTAHGVAKFHALRMNQKYN